MIIIVVIVFEYFCGLGFVGYMYYLLDFSFLVILRNGSNFFSFLGEGTRFRGENVWRMLYSFRVAEYVFIIYC